MSARPAAAARRGGALAPADTSRWQRQRHAGRRWAVWGALLGVAAGTAASAPAQWLADALQQASGQRLLLAEARGSLWNGSAVLVLTGGAGSQDAAALPGRLQWQLRPSWHGLQLAAQQSCCLRQPLQLQLQPGWNGWALALGDDSAAVNPTNPATGTAPAHPQAAGGGGGVIGTWPAAWLAGLGTPWNTLALGGLMQVASPGPLRLQSVAGRLQLQGTLALELQGVSSRLSTLPALGSYRLLLQGNGADPGTGAAGRPGRPAANPVGAPDSGAARLQLDTLDGALRLSGNGQWNGAKLRFRGQAQAAEGQEAALSNLLNIIGRRQGALSVISIG